VWRPSGSPIVIAVLTNRRAADAASDDALIADVTRSAIGDLTASGQG
jgi:beta-lactamase class A